MIRPRRIALYGWAGGARYVLCRVCDPAQREALACLYPSRAGKSKSEARFRHNIEAVVTSRHVNSLSFADCRHYTPMFAPPAGLF